MGRGVVTLFWVANLVVWAVCAAVSAQGAFVAAFMSDRACRGDPMRLATFLVSFLFVGQTTRWLIIPDDTSFWKALYIVGAITGIYVVRLMVAYGRGDRV